MQWKPENRVNWCCQASCSECRASWQQVHLCVLWLSSLQRVWTRWASYSGLKLMFFLKIWDLCLCYVMVMILWLYYIINMCNWTKFDGDNVLEVEVHNYDILVKWIWLYSWVNDYIHAFIYPWWAGVLVMWLKHGIF